MTDQDKDAESKKTEEVEDVEVAENKEDLEVKRFDPEALVSDNNDLRMEDDAIYVDDMYGIGFWITHPMSFLGVLFPMLMMV